MLLNINSLCIYKISFTFWNRHLISAYLKALNLLFVHIIIHVFGLYWHFALIVVATFKVTKVKIHTVSSISPSLEAFVLCFSNYKYKCLFWKVTIAVTFFCLFIYLLHLICRIWEYTLAESMTLCFICFFEIEGSLVCSSDWPWVHYVAQTSLELCRDPPVSASAVLRLQVYTTTPDL